MLKAVLNVYCHESFSAASEAQQLPHQSFSERILDIKPNIQVAWTIQDNEHSRQPSRIRTIENVSKVCELIPEAGQQIIARNNMAAVHCLLYSSELPAVAFTSCLGIKIKLKANRFGPMEKIINKRLKMLLSSTICYRVSLGTFS